MDAAKPSLVRAINLRATFDLVNRSGPVAAPDVVRRTGLSKPTVADVLNQLVEAGILIRVGRTSGLPGPTAQLYDVNPRAGWVMSIDIGREWLRAALCDLKGNVVGQTASRTPRGTARAVIARLRQEAARLTATAGIQVADVNQIVVGTPGVVRPGETHFSLAPQLAGWESPSVIHAIRDALEAPVRFENDVNMAAVGEHVRGAAVGCDDFVLLSVGTGVGIGVVVDGAVRRGARGLAGEIGYLRFDLDADLTDAHPAGWGTGAYEAQVSSAAIADLAQQQGLPAMRAEAVFGDARRGDPRAQRVVEVEARRLAYAVAAIAAILDPELVVLGGGIGTGGGDLLLRPMSEALAAISPFTTRLAASTLGGDAVIAGCTALGLELAYDSLFAVGSPARRTAGHARVDRALRATAHHASTPASI